MSLASKFYRMTAIVCLLALVAPACNRDVYDNLFDPVNQYTVTFDSQGGTAVSAQTVDYGSTISQPADPVLTGYTFAGWFTEPGCANPWLFGSGKVECDATLYARWTINQYTVAFDPQGGSAIAPQTVNYNDLAADPGAPARTGYTFGGWFREAGCVTQWTFPTDTITENRTLFAQWTINTYTLTYTAGANGSLTGSTTQFVTHGANGTAVTAVPNAGHHFTSWSDGVLSATRTDTGVTGDITVTANFAINQYTLSYSAGPNGSLSGATAQVVDHGSDGTAVTAAPNVGYHFTSWSDGSTDNPRTDTNVTGTITVSANFAINTYTLTYTAGANGSITGTTPQTVNHGASGSAVTATPNVGYHFTSWSDGVLTATRTDINVTGAITVTASFAINTYTLTYNAGAGGSITGSSPQTVNHGANGTAVTAAPNVGYHFTSWSDGGVIATRTDTNITGDLTVTASFAIDQYTVSFDSQGGSAVDPQLVNYGGLAIEPTAPSRTGYAFLGWHKESACTTPWAFAGDIVTGATTLYAKWGTAGELDTSLDPGTGANDNIHSIAIQSDQKIIIGGEFTDFDGTSIIRLARLNANGSLDTTFNPGSGPYIMWQTFSYVYAIAIQSDGKIMIGGGFSHYNGTPVNHIARVNIDGSLDTTFNQGSGCTGYVKALAIQSDGKILIGGSFSSYNGTSREKIVRVNADGSIDTTFDPGSGAQDWPVNSIAIQSDGKIMIAGQFSYFNGTVRERMARLNANGSLDMSFTPGFNANNTANSVAIQGDGKILVGGWFSNYNGSWSHSGRLNADGSIDTAFATNAGYGTSGNVYSIVLQADGKILAGGIFTAYNLISRNRIARVNTDGTLDTTFVPGSGADAAINAIAIQSNGYIVIGGAFTSYNGTARNRIARIIP